MIKYKEAVKLGFNARLEGMSQKACPYDEKSTLGRWWIEGYNKAKHAQYLAMFKPQG